jgi:hypothetical protein
MSTNNLTPIDVAGKHKSHESAILIITHLYKKRKYISKLFGINQNNRADKLTNSSNNKIQDE